MPCDGAEKDKLRVLVVGSGGVGTMACIALELSGIASVSAVLRSNYQHVKEHGFEIDSVDYGKLSQWRPTRVLSAVPDANPAEPFDYVVVTVKTIPEISNVPEIIRPAVSGSKSTIVLIQNGVGIEQPFLDSFPSSVILSVASMISSHERNGHIIHDDHDKSWLGVFYNPSLDRPYQDSKAKEFTKAYNVAGADCHIVPDVAFARWRKVLWNGVFNPLCAITGLDSGAIRLHGGDNSLIKPAMAEMMAIARADGCDLPDGLLNTMRESTPIELAFRPSMLVDVDKGNPVEVEVILGNPLRIARKHGVATPTLDYTYRVLKLIQARLLHARGLIPTPTEVSNDVFI